MNGDDRFPEPGPVAEYRDPELVRRFERDVVPQHGAGFWTEFEARIGGGEPEIDDADESEPTTLLSQSVEPPLELAPGWSDRWGPGRFLAVAAAVLAVLGLGGAVLVGQNRSSSPVESASPSLDQGADDTPASEERETNSSSTVTTMALTTTTAAPTSTTSAPSSATDAPVGYFDDDARFDSIGPGQVVAFSPDDSAILVLDDAPGVVSGCEGGEMLALYSQDLATGQRRPTMGDDARIETGGVDLMIDPFGATPDEVATRPIYGQEWCEGESSARWRGVLSSDGQISMLEEVAVDGPDDPFVGQPAGGGPGSTLTSPDGDFVLSLSGSTTEVSEIDTDGDGVSDVTVAPIPDGVDLAAVTAAAWSPDSQVIALGINGSVVLWSPWNGASQSFESGPASEIFFDGTGGRLAVVGPDKTTLLTFGDRAEPVPAPPRCSGRVAFGPLSFDGLVGDGLPEAVATTVLAIDAAAGVCDWDALDRLASDGFVASLGDDDPVASWTADEANFGSPMWYLRTLLRQPHIIETDEKVAVHLWPAINQDDDCQLDEGERASAIALGLDPVATEEACVVIGGYAGYQTTIDDNGTWRSFLGGA